MAEILVLLGARAPVSGKEYRVHRVDIGRPTCGLVNREQFANVPPFSTQADVTAQAINAAAREK